MKTISNNIETFYEIKNSKFITLLFKIDDNFNLEEILDEVKDKYPKATHYCYAYRLIGKEKSSDDGEPGGTAGIPMLNVLIKENIVNILVITVRYFGGIKLGAGGLVRAYTKSLTTALENINYIDLIDGYIVEIIEDYSNSKQLDYLLKNIKKIDKQFDNNIKYLIEISKDNIELIKNYNYKIIEEKLIEKTLSN